MRWGWPQPFWRRASLSIHQERTVDGPVLHGIIGQFPEPAGASERMLALRETTGVLTPQELVRYAADSRLRSYILRCSFSGSIELC
jgi:hypothetical protein